MKTRLLIIFAIAVCGVPALSYFLTIPDANAQIMYSSSYSPTTIPLSDVYSITTKQIKYNIPYNITNSTIDEIIPYCESNSLVIRITSNDSGTLVIDIPRDLLDMKHEDKDKEFIILVDGEETSYNETGHAQSREYGILLSSGSKEIEIIGTFGLSDNITNVSCDVIHNPPYSHILPPLKQMKNDVSFQEVICHPNLSKIYKFYEQKHIPVCVDSGSISKLTERGWAKKESKGDSHILKYSPVVIRGTGMMVQEDLLSLEDLRLLEKRKLELDTLIEDPNIAEKERNELYDEQELIILHADMAFNEKVSWELVKTLWEKSTLFSEKFGTYDREKFPIPSFSGVTFGLDAYSLDERYAGKVAGIKVGIVKEKFTRETLERTDKMLREIVGNEIDIVYYKSGYITLDSP